MFGSGWARLRFRMLSGPLPAEVGKDGVLRETNRTVEAGAIVFSTVGDGPGDVGFGVGAMGCVHQLFCGLERNAGCGCVY
jgi:hypothetical protein